ncbi:MAG: hypothetical protein JRD68_16030 [Deltaproteobacteria bacterium]|nr:hypothetical protein [Deltaproteobacteria bacterium]
MKLILGCGRLQMTLPPGREDEKDWLSVDIRPDIQSHIRADFTRLHQFVKAGKVDEIYSCHSLEHIEREILVATLLSWWRVLKPGGKVIIRLPDFKYHVEKWLHESPETQIFSNMNIFYGPGSGPMAHRNGFTLYSLQRYAEIAGFQALECTEFESRYGENRGDLLYIGRKIERERKNLAQWIPLCAWPPFFFQSNMQYLGNIVPGANFHLLKEKYAEDIFLFEEQGRFWYRNLRVNNAVLDPGDPGVKIESIGKKIEKVITTDTEAILTSGGSIRFIPSLMELKDRIGHLKVVILDEIGNELAAALAINDLSGLPKNSNWRILGVPTTRQNISVISGAMNLNQEKTVFLDISDFI